MPETLVTIAYLAAGLLFIFSLGGLSAQESARRGNLFGMLGMLMAVVVTTLGPRVDSYLVLSIALMAVAANLIVGLLKRWPILNYIGLALIVYVAGKMIVDGSQVLKF